VPRRSEGAAADPRGGFSLVEVLIALVILSVGLLALEGLGVSAARLVAASQRHNAFVSNTAAMLERSVAQVRSGASVDTATKSVSGGTVKVTSTTSLVGGRTFTTLIARAVPAANAQSYMRSDTVVLQSYVY
jgi:prepilin-type N-terminal cleavage/methylation domain-containing protein